MNGDRGSLDHVVAAAARSRTVQRWVIGAVTAGASYAATWAWGWNASLARVAALDAIEQRVAALELAQKRVADLEGRAKQRDLDDAAEVESDLARDIAFWRAIVLLDGCPQNAATCATVDAYDDALDDGKTPEAAARRALKWGAPPGR